MPLILLVVTPPDCVASPLPPCPLSHQVDFTVRSEGAPWVGERRYSSLTAAAKEVGDSRLWGGVHFPSANADGLTLGRLVAKQVLARLKGGRTAPALVLGR
jgi:hypothetical protein